MKKWLVLVGLVAIIGCTDAEKSQFSSLGSKFQVKQYSGGQLIGEWYSTGKVSTEERSDGYYFTDAKTNKLIHVAGTVQIIEK